MSNRHTRSRWEEERRPAANRLMLWILSLCIAAGVVLAGMFYLRSSGDLPRAAPEARTPGKAAAPSAEGRKELPSLEEANDVLLIADDGQTLWVSPTNGPPIDLRYLPPGCQIFAALRWSELIKHDEGEGMKLLSAMGLRYGLDALRDGVDAGPIPVDLPRILIGLRVDSAGAWSMNRVVFFERTLNEGQKGYFQETYSSEEHAGERYGIDGELAYYFPNEPRADRLVISQRSRIADIIDLAGEPPPLRRDMERLLAHTDSRRIATVAFPTNVLYGAGGGESTGELGRLRDALFWFLGDEPSAVVLSMHWDENFFIELIATPTLDTPPERAARILMERLAEAPDRVEQYLGMLEPRPYGREILARFPAMLRTLVQYTRGGVEDDMAVLRCYLPPQAGHNLLAAAELALAEQRPRSDTVAPGGANDEFAADEPLRARLQRFASLRLARDTLQAALDRLAQDIGVTITIRGPDLQAEGITKNQSFEVNMEQRRAEEILVEILRLANPDKTATGPADERQRLVYVIGPTGAGGAEQIIVTTRAAAAARGEALPAVFGENAR
jgi:hypothetical protein